MLRRLFYRMADAMEDRLGVSMEYLRDMADASTLASIKFALFMPLAQHRRALPVDAYHVARLMSTRSQDCGPCVQIIVNQALDEGVSPDHIEAVLTDNPEQLPPLLSDVYQYAGAVARHRPAAHDCRERIVEEVGEEGIVELSLGMASAQVFPITKRGMGHGASCRKVDIQLGDDARSVRTVPPARR